MQKSRKSPSAMTFSDFRSGMGNCFILSCTIKTPLTKSEIQKLKIGQEVFLSGKIFTARDHAHKRLVELIHKRKKLPIDLIGQIIYYCGPARTPRGKIIGACGPTTSSRMDEFTPVLLKAGLKGMIGKGSRSKEAIRAIKKYKAVYFLTYAGCGALLSRYIRKKRLVAYADLGPEAIYELAVKDFPLIVAIDSKGRNIYGARPGYKPRGSQGRNTKAALIPALKGGVFKRRSIKSEG